MVCKPANLTIPPSGLWGWTGWLTLGDIFFLFVVLFNQLIPIEFAMVTASFVLVRCHPRPP